MPRPGVSILLSSGIWGYNNFFFTEKNAYFTIDYLCRLRYNIIKYDFA